MKRISRAAAATIGGLVLLVSADARAQRVSGGEVAKIAAVSTVTAGSIHGVVQDEKGAPVTGALVSAVGATSKVAVTDRSGRFELRTLSPGSYVVKAQLTGFVTSRAQIIEVRPSVRTASAIALRRASAVASSATTPPVLEAGVGALDVPVAQPEPAVDRPASTVDDDHSELAWRLRHLPRSVLRDLDGLPIPEDGGFVPQPAAFAPTGATSAARMAANFFAATPFSGQFNLLTTSAFDSPQQLFSGDVFSRSVAYLAVGAPAGSHADWAVRGALSQADISAWVVAGTYSTRGSGKHGYDVGLSYATQRYDGGNPAALRDVTDGSRNAGAVYGFDTFTVTPAVAVTYGGRYARYDYLDQQSLISPRVGVTISPGHHFRLSALASRRAVAPGAEEFLPPGDTGIWLPPQRTFSPLSADRPLTAEQTMHVEIGIERDLGPDSAVSVRTFRQNSADQLVTLFGIDIPGLPQSSLGHYFVGNFGDVSAHGVTAAFRTAIAHRVQGSVEYSVSRAEWEPGRDREYWMLRLPSAASLGSNRIHDVSTAIETDVPETATRVVVLYRISSAFANRKAEDDALLGSRFDVQVHQSLPFLDFSTAKWEMLVGVRNFFRETAADQSMYDELLVVHPPKRIVGGLTMRF